MKYPFVRPELPTVDQWEQLLEGAYARRYFTNFGELETDLSGKLAGRFGGRESAVTLVANATCGLTAALIAHEIRGHVAIPNFTFPATLDAVLSARCTPVLCDSDPQTGEMSEDSLLRVCRRYDLAAVVPVRTYGFMRDLSPLLNIARSNNATVIIDAAAALGAGRIDVAPDVTEVVSLHATKSFGIGEGGAIFSHRCHTQAMRRAINFGLQEDRRFRYGINGKMSEFHAAIGLAQLAHVEKLIAGRKLMAKWYTELLVYYERLTLPELNVPTAWSNYPIWLSQHADAEAFQAACHARGLQVRRYYWPTLAEGFSEELDGADDLSVSTDLAERAVCLPLYASTTLQERAEIAEILTSVLDDIEDTAKA